MDLIAADRTPRDHGALVHRAGAAPFASGHPPSTAEDTGEGVPVGLFDEIVSREGIFAMTKAERTQLRLSLAREALGYHLARNRAYAAYCQRLGIDDSSLQGIEDLARIPLLPTSLFKAKPELVCSGAIRDGILFTTSSGTQGRISSVPRDDLTLMRFFSGISSAVREMLGLANREVRVFNLGPTPQEAPHLWIAYVMAGLALFFRGQSYVSGNVFDLERLAGDLASAVGRCAIIGPPPLVLDLADFLSRRGGLSIAPESFVITIGGWKRRSAEWIPRGQFDERVVSALRLPDESALRDTFNMVELNSVFVECRRRRKHCPPWLAVYARDPQKLTALPPGRSGILSFVDPSAVSYPDFLLSDDVGRVETGPCGCGLDGESIVVERRLSPVEDRGCARKLDFVVRDRIHESERLES